MTGPRGVRSALAVFVAAVVLALGSACGVPTGGAPETVAASSVPYGLTSDSAGPTATAAPTSDPRAGGPHVFLMAEDDSLVPRSRDVTGTSRADRLDALLAALAAGPTSEERGLHLSSALPPDVTLSVAGIVGGTATIDITGAADAPSGRESRRAVAQIVLTATSVPGVDAVLLTQGGEPVDAPLPSGALTTEPLTASNYATFLTPAATPSSAAATSAGPTSAAPSS